MVKKKKNFFKAKHLTKKKIKMKIKRLIFILKITVNTIIFKVVIYKLNIITKSCSKAVKKRHDQKLYELAEKMIVQLQMTGCSKGTCDLLSSSN